MMRKFSKITMCGVLALVLTMPAFAASFSDVNEDAPYAEAVEYLNDIGIMQGDENGNFNPDSPISRAEIATLVCRMLGKTENLTTADIFTDVPISHWANGYITKAAEFGIVGGYGDGQFGPEDAVIYEQAVTMIIRTVGGETEAVEAGGYPVGYISVADENGLLQGVSTSMGSPMSRADIAVLLYNCLG